MPSISASVTAESVCMWRTVDSLLFKCANVCMHQDVVTECICDRLWEKGPFGSGDQFSVYCPIRKNLFGAFKCTLKHKKLISLTKVIAF